MIGILLVVLVLSFDFVDLVHWDFDEGTVTVDTDGWMAVEVVVVVCWPWSHWA